MGYKRLDWSERGGFDKSVLRPGDSRCILRTRKEGTGGKQRTTKAEVFANDPLRTGGFGGTLNNAGYGGAAPSREISSGWQVGEDHRKSRRRK